MLPADARTSFSRTRNTYSIFACGAPPPPPSGSNATVSARPVFCVSMRSVLSPVLWSLRTGALFSARKELHPVPAIMNSVTLTSDSPRSFGKYLNGNYAFCNLPRSRTTWTKEAGGKTC